MSSLSERVRLVPVLELMPAHFLSRDRAMPSAEASIEDWDRYRIECDGDFARIGLQPLERLSWHIPLSQLTDPHILEEILRRHCAPGDAEDSSKADEFFGDVDTESFEALPGGYALISGEAVQFTPRCCADLGDIAEWRSAAEHRDQGVRRIWIGHPSLDVRYDGSYLVFTEEEAAEGEEQTCRLDPQSLQRAVNSAEQGLLFFYNTLLPVVRNTFGAARAVEITEILTGLRNYR